MNVVVNSRWKPPYQTSDVLGFCPGVSRVILKEDPWLALHELGHVIGLIHEHQRSDRSRYVDIPPEDKDPNWILLKDSINFGLPYDGRSMTHYGLDWRGGRRDDGRREPGQQWSELSESDIRGIQILYDSKAENK